MRDEYISFAGEFAIAFEYVSKNGTGTGEIGLSIDTVDKIPVGECISICSLENNSAEHEIFSADKKR